MVEVLRARRPFWVHQLVEYLIGIVLISAGIQSPEPAVLAVMGLIVMINAAVSIGPAGAFRLVNRKTHRVLDVVVMGLLVAAAVQPWFPIDGTGQLMLGAIAFVLFFVWFHTDFDTRDERKARRARQARPSSEDVGRQAGRLFGGGVNAVRQQWKSLSGSEDTGDSDRPAS
jgi:cation transport ATPase